MRNHRARSFRKLAAWSAAGLGAWALFRRLRNPLELRGRTVLITGGARGLGLVLAREFLRQGAKVAICARDGGEVERAREDLVLHGSHVLAAVCDVTDRQEVRRLVRHVRDRFGPVEILVNNAGVIQVGPYETMTVEDYELAMKTHFWAAYFTISEVLDDMRARRFGRIINISSIGGKVSVPHLLPYCASKFALTGFSEGLSSE